MLDNALKVLTEMNMYSISLIIIVGMFLFSFFSEQFKQGFKTPLQLFIVIWVILFGYQVYKGNSLYSDIIAPSQKQIDAERYEKHMIDGREVFYDKATGEVVKNPKKPKK